MATKKTTRTRTARRTSASASAPAIVYHLINAYVPVDTAVVDGAYQHAIRILRQSAQIESAGSFIEPVAEADLKQDAPDVLTSEMWEEHAGEIYRAVMDPAFSLGFALAYLMYSERVGMNPEFFERLRIDGLYNAFRSLDERRQQKVVRFANGLAMERTRAMAARSAKRGKNVRKLTGWIGGAQ